MFGCGLMGSRVYERETNFVCSIALHELGRAMSEQGKLKDAIPFYQQALDLKSASLPSNHISKATTLHEIGRCLYNQGDFIKAEGYLKRALSIKDKALKKEDPERAKTLHVLGGCLLQLGEYTESEKILQSLIGIRTRTVPSSDPNIIADLTGLGRCLIEQGKMIEAETTMRQAMAAAKVLSTPHWITVVSAWLALCIQRNGGNLEEVHRLLQQSTDTLDVLTDASKGLGMIDTYTVVVLVN
jgi:tetratricopeptide (TPR) repeat protein